MEKTVLHRRVIFKEKQIKSVIHPDLAHLNVNLPLKHHVNLQLQIQERFVTKQTFIFSTNIIFKRYPTLQECAKPNLMSDCPKPDCAWDAEDECNKGKGKSRLLIGLLLAAATLGAVSFFLVFHYKLK